jgi:hypothetical protein
MKLATRSIKTTDTKYRYVLDGQVVKNQAGTVIQTQDTELEGDVTLEVDVDRLLQMLGGKALRSKSHKAIEASGAIVVTARVTSSKAGDWK